MEIIYSFPSYSLAICMIFLTFLSHATTLSLTKITQSPRFGTQFDLPFMIPPPGSFTILNNLEEYINVVILYK